MVSDAVNIYERLRIKRLLASAYARSGEVIWAVFNNRPRNGWIAFHSCSETKYIFTSLLMWPFLFWPFWYAAVLNFYCALLVWFVAVLVVVVLDVILTQAGALASQYLRCKNCRTAIRGKELNSTLSRDELRRSKQGLKCREWLRVTTGHTVITALIFRYSSSHL